MNEEWNKLCREIDAMEKAVEESRRLSPVQLAAQKLGAIKTKKKAKASRANGRKGGRPILWTNDAARIARLFCRFDAETGVVSVHTPLGDVTSKVNPEVADPCGLVGMALAGKPLGKTQEIVRALKLGA